MASKGLKDSQNVQIWPCLYTNRFNSKVATLWAPIVSSFHFTPSSGKTLKGTLNLYYKRTTIHHTDLKGIHHVVEHEFIIQLQCAQGAILPIEIQTIYVVLNKVAKWGNHGSLLWGQMCKQKLFIAHGRSLINSRIMPHPRKGGSPKATALPLTCLKYNFQKLLFFPYLSSHMVILRVFVLFDGWHLTCGFLCCWTWSLTRLSACKLFVTAIFSLFWGTVELFLDFPVNLLLSFFDWRIEK